MPAIVNFVTESDLDAYIDDELDEDDRAVVEALLRDDDRALRRVLSGLRDKAILQKAFTQLIDSPPGKLEQIDRAIEALACKLEQQHEQSAQSSDHGQVTNRKTHSSY